MKWVREHLELLLFVSSTALLLVGGLLWLLGAVGPAEALWVAGTVLGAGVLGVVDGGGDPTSRCLAGGLLPGAPCLDPGAL